VEHKTMRLLPVFLFSLVVPILRAQESPGAAVPKSPYVERQEKQFKFYPGGKVGISMEVPGSLKIIGWKKGVLRMEAEKIVYYDTAEKAKAFLEKSPIRVKYNQTSATISTPKSTGQDENIEMNITVYVPGDKTDIKAMVYKGDLSIDDVNGWVEINMLDGSLQAKSLSGYFSSHTQRGNISVEMSDARWRGLEFAAATDEGSVELRLPEKYSAALQLETRDGEITVDYPHQIVEGEPHPPDIVISKAAQLLSATLGDGGAPVKLATNSGNISMSAIR
jgi:DUF4097 and DUF4098 domain-containing protein YvlB